IPDYLYRQTAEIIVQHTRVSTLIKVLTNENINTHIRVVLAQALAATGQSALVPDLLTILANPVVSEEVRMSIAEAIGMLGEDKTSVEKLLGLWQFYALRDPLHVSVLVDVIHQALWAVSRRVGVTIVRMGAEYRVLERFMTNTTHFCAETTCAVELSRPWGIEVSRGVLLLGKTRSTYKGGRFIILFLICVFFHCLLSSVYQLIILCKQTYTNGCRTGGETNMARR